MLFAHHSRTQKSCRRRRKDGGRRARANQAHRRRLRMEPLEDRMLLSITPAQAGEITGGLEDLRAFGHDLGLFQNLDAHVPIVNQSLGSVLDIGGIIESELLAPAEAYLNSGDPTTGELAGVLDSSDALDVIDGSDTDADLGAILFDVSLNKTVTIFPEVDLGTEALHAGLFLEDPPAIEMSAELTFDFQFGINPADDKFFIDKAKLSVRGIVNETLDFGLNFGFLHTEAVGGTFDVSAELEVVLTDPNTGDAGITRSELETLFDQGLVSLATASSSLDVNLPVDVSFLGLGVPPTVVMTVGDDFFGAAPAVELRDFDCLSALDDALLGGLDALAVFGNNLDTGDKLGAELPLLGTSLGEVADLGGLFLEGLANPLRELLDAPGPRTAGDLVAKIRDEALPAPGLGAFNIQVGHSLVGDEFTFDVAFDVARQKRVALELGTEVEEFGLTLDGEFPLDVVTDVHLDLTFGVDLAKLPGAGDAFFVKLNGGSVTPKLQIPEETLSGRFAILDVDAVVSDKVSETRLDAPLTVELVDQNGDGQISLSELQGTGIEELANVSLAGNSSLAVGLALSANLAGLGVTPGTEPTILLSDSDLFNGVMEGSLDTRNFGKIESFRNLSAVSLQDQFRKLGVWLGEVSRSSGFDVEIPLTDGTKLSDVLDFSNVFDDKVFDAITFSDQAGDGSSGEPGGPAFTTIGGLADLLTGDVIKNLEYHPAGTYDPDNAVLTFELDFDETVEGLETDLAFGFDLGRLAGLETSSTITLTPSLDANMKLGVLLQQPGADFVLDNNTLLDELNGGAGVLIDEGVADLRVQLRDGSTFEVTFDGATDVGQVLQTLRQAAADAGWFDAQINTETKGIDLIQGDDVPDNGFQFETLAINNSVAGHALRIVGRDRDGEGRILGGPLHGQTYSDLFFIEDAKLEAELTLTASDVDATANLGFVGVSVDDATASGTVKASLEFGDPAGRADDGQITLREGSQAINEIALLLTAENAVEFGPGNSGMLNIELGGGVTGEQGQVVSLNFDASEEDGTLDDLVIDLNDTLDTLGHHDLLRAVSWDGRLSFTLVDGVARTLQVTGTDATKLGFEDGQQAYVLMPRTTLAAEFTDWSVAVNALGIDLGTSPSLDVTVSEFSLFDLRLPDFDASDSVDVIGLDTLGDLPSFDDLTYTDIAAGLREVLSFITEIEGLDFLDTELPLLEVRVKDLLGFGEEFLAFVEDFENGFEGTLQDVGSYIEKVPGLSNPSLSLEETEEQLALRIDFVFEAVAQESLAVKLDLFELLEGATGLNLDFLNSFEDLIDVGGSAALDFEAKAALNLSLGIGLGTEPTVFLYDNGTGVEITAKAVGTDIDFDAVLGPLGIFVRNGAAGINRYGNDLEREDPDDPESPIKRDVPAGLIVSFHDADDDGRILFTELFAGGGLTDIVEFDFAAQAFADLPVHVPEGDTEANIGTIDFALAFPSLEEFTNPILTLNTDEFPDFSQVLGDFDLSENLLAMVGGWEGAFDLITDAMRGEVFGFTVPLVGDALGGAADFLVDLKETVADTMQTMEAQSIGLVQTSFFDALGPDGLDWLQDAQLEGEPGFGVIDTADVGVTRTPEFGVPDEIKFNFSLGQDLLALDLPFAFDIGFPGLGLDVDADLQMLLGFDFDIGFGVSLNKGVFLDTSAENELTIKLEVLLPDFAATGSLGFLQVDVYEDRDRPAEDPPTRLVGEFTVDLKDPDSDGSLTIGEIFAGVEFSDLLAYDYDIYADVDLDIVTSLLGRSMLPRIRTDFAMDWDLQKGQESETTISFDNIELNLGDFFDGFAGEVLGTVRDVLDPIQPLINVLTTPIPVISDLAGPTTLVDLARIFGRGDVAAFVDSVVTINDFVYSLPEDLGPESWIQLGSFDVNAALAADEGSEGPGDGEQAVNELIEQYDAVTQEEIENQVSDRAGSGSSKFTKSAGFQGKGKLEFPILSDPLSIFNLLMGQDIDLFIFDAPPLVVDFSYAQTFPIPAFPIVAAEIGGRIAAKADFAFGFDTSGIRQFLGSGDFLDVFGGFYISDRLHGDGTGPDVPELVVEGQLTAGGKVTVAIAEAGVRGGIFTTVNFDLNDPNQDGRVRPNELAENFKLGPIFIFDVSGNVRAGLQAFLNVNLGLFTIDKTFDLASITLVEFEIPRPEDVVQLATQDGGTLLLDMGDASENFTLKEGFTPGSVIVEGLGRSQEFQDILQITGFAGDGDDTITISEGLTMPVFLDGGRGDDQLRAGGGAVVFYGGEGNDLLVGSDADDRLFAGPGDDTLNGGLGNDTLYGGAGRDRLEGEAGDDVLQGESGRDHLDGGAGDDRLEGGDDGDVLQGKSGNDAIFGEGGDDLIEGGLGHDEIHGGAGNDAVYGEKGRDVIYGDDGMDVIDGGAENDDIFGGKGNDDILGGSGVDVIRGGEGDDLIRGGEASDLLFGDVGNDTIYAADSPDGGQPDVVHTIEGGPGSDTIYGDMGIDTIYGDDSSGATEDDGADRIWSLGGDDFIDAGDGNDVVYSGQGRDFVVGGYGDDQLYGDEGRDALFGGLVVLPPADFFDPAATFEFPPGILDAEALFATGFLPDPIVPTNLGGQSVDGVIDDGKDVIRGEGDNDWLFGGSQADDLFGGPGSDYLDAGAGNDVNLSGGPGHDVIRGGADNDVIRGDEGIDWIYGDAGDDRLFGDAGEADGTLAGQRLFGGSGSDQLFAFAPSDNPAEEAVAEGDDLHGGTGNDFLFGNLRREHFFGGDGSDYIHGDYLAGPGYAENTNAALDGGGDVIFAGSGQDQVYGGGGDDVIYGGADTDLLEGQDGTDTISGGAGIDVIVADVRPEYFDTGPDDQDDVAGHRDAGPDHRLDTGDETPDDNATDILLVNGSQFNDTISLGRVPEGEPLAGQLRMAYTSIDVSEVVRFNRNIDMIWLDAEGRPLIEQFRVAGLGGDDRLEFIEGLNALDLSDLMGRGRDFVGVLDGGPGDDTLIGSPARDRLDGGVGSDLLFGRAGDDRLWGDGGEGFGTDEDVLFAGAGNDDLIGGQGTNELYAWSRDPNLGSQFGVFVDLNSGSLHDDSGDDDGDGFLDDEPTAPARVLENTGLNRMVGSPHDDLLFGGTQVDFLYGNGGNDTLFRSDGSRFEDLDGGDAGDEWKAYARATGQVWYVGATNLDDEIDVNFVTEPGLLGDHHLITRLTKNIGEDLQEYYSFSAQVRLDFAATDEEGGRLWDAADVLLDLDAFLAAADEPALGEEQYETRQEALDDLAQAERRLVNGLLPPEGDFLAIIIDALGGDDLITIGPTVQKTVWIDAGPGDDRVEIRDGNAILVDKAEGGTRNDLAEDAYTLILPSEPGEPRSGSFAGLTMDSPEDVDWFVFDLPREPVGDARLVLTSLSENDGLTLSLFEDPVEDPEAPPLRVADPAGLGLDAADAVGPSNDTLENAYPLDAIEALARVTGLTLHAPDDQDWFKFTVSERPPVEPGAVEPEPDRIALTYEADVQPESSNLALGGTATQSSTYDNADAARAIDGITDGDYGNDSVTHTQHEENSWWQVDLDNQFVLQTVTLHNRTDWQSYGLFERLSNFIVSVLCDGVEVWSQHYDTPPDPEPIQFDLPDHTIGDTVRVQLDGWNKYGDEDGVLSLAEVQIFGHQPGIELYDDAGNLLRTGQTSWGGGLITNTLDLAQLDPGDYFLRVSSSEPTDGSPLGYELAPAVDNRPEAVGRALLDLSGPGGSELSLAGLAPGVSYYAKVEAPGRNPTVYDLQFVLDDREPVEVDLGVRSDSATRRDVIIGGEGNDMLAGGPGEDFIFGGPGNDVLTGGLDRHASDLLFANEGDDTLQIIPDRLPLLKGTDQTYVPTLVDRFDGGPGDDQVLFLGGDFEGDLTREVPDFVAIRYNRFLHRYEFTSLVWDTANQEFMKDTGSDTFQQTFLFYQARNVEHTVIDTRAGDDEVRADPEFKFPNVDSEWGISPGDYQQGALLAALEIRGGPGNDRLFGGALDDAIYGGEGVDLILGGGGDDLIDGGPGDDLLAGDTIIEPDRLEFVTRQGAGGLNDEFLFAAELPVVSVGSAVAGLTLHDGDGGDWYHLQTPPAFWQYGDTFSALLKPEMIQVRAVVEDPADGSFQPTGTKLDFFLFPAADADPDPDVLELVPQERFTGVPEHYLLHVLRSEAAVRYQVDFVAPLGAVIDVPPEAAEPRIDVNGLPIMADGEDLGGQPVAISLGDIGGTDDGRVDLILRVRNDAPDGKSYARVSFGSDDLYSPSADSMLLDLPAPLFVEGLGPRATIGSPGDYDADGLDDLAVAVSGVSIEVDGVYVLFGRDDWSDFATELVYTGSGGQIVEAAVFTLSGDRGDESISVAASENLTAVAERINDKSHLTGVTASVDADKLTLTGVEYGTRAQVSVVVTSGTFDVSGNAIKVDVVAEADLVFRDPDAEPSEYGVASAGNVAVDALGSDDLLVSTRNGLFLFEGRSRTQWEGSQTLFEDHLIWQGTNEDGFASGEDELATWTLGPHVGDAVWQFTTDRDSPFHPPLDDPSLQHALYFGTESGNYNSVDSKSQGIVSSRSITIPAAAQSAKLSFSYFLQTEPNEDGYDLARVLVNGLPLAGAANTAAGKLSDTVDEQGAYGWRQVEFDLSDFIGQTVTIGFEFDSVDQYNNGYEGWYVDDVAVSFRGFTPDDAIRLLPDVEIAGARIAGVGDLSGDGRDDAAVVTDEAVHLVLGREPDVFVYSESDGVEKPYWAACPFEYMTLTDPEGFAGLEPFVAGNVDDDETGGPAEDQAPTLMATGNAPESEELEFPVEFNLFYHTNLQEEGDLLFDDDVVTLPHGLLDGRTDLTVEFKWKTNQAGFQAVLSGANAGSNNEFLIFAGRTQLVIYDHGASLTAFYYGADIGDGQWHHFAVVREPLSASTVQFSLYIDGDLKGTQSLNVAETIHIDPNGLVLGQEQDVVGGAFDPTQALRGRLDDVRIWETVRSENEIRDNRDLDLTGDETGLLACYGFNEVEGSTVESLPAGFDGTLGGLGKTAPDRVLGRGLVNVPVTLPQGTSWQNAQELVDKLNDQLSDYNVAAGLVDGKITFTTPGRKGSGADLSVSGAEQLGFSGPKQTTVGTDKSGPLDDLILSSADRNILIFGSDEFAAGKLWSVDFQGAGGQVPKPDPDTMSGVEPYYGFGNVWNAFDIQGHTGDATGVSVNPEMDLFDSDGNPTSVHFAVDGTVSGWSEDGDDLKHDYLFVQAGNADPSADWEISGLMPGGIYEMFAYGSINHNATIVVDVDGNADLDDDTEQLVASDGHLFAGIRADTNGLIIGKILPVNDAQANWAGFQLRQVSRPADPLKLPGVGHLRGIGDFNGDGVDDLAAAVLEPGSTLNESDEILQHQVTQITFGTTSRDDLEAGFDLPALVLESGSPIYRDEIQEAVLWPIGDVDGDGLADLAVADQFGGVVRIYPGAALTPADVIPGGPGNSAEKLPPEVFRFELATPTLPQSGLFTRPGLDLGDLPADAQGTLLEIRDAFALEGGQAAEALSGARMIGDVNGDGIDDLLVEGHDTAYLLLGPVELDALAGIETEADVIIDTASLGKPAERLGDVDGDGVTDLVFQRLETRQSSNLALGGTATQSSDAWGGDPARAIDGNTDGKYWNGSVTHTDDLEDSWWQVKLGEDDEEFVLQTITLYNRTDESPQNWYERLSNFIVSVWRGGVEVWSQHYDTTPPDSGPLHLDLPDHTIGNTVRVQLNGWNYAETEPGALSLAEVEVFGYQQHSNLALDGVASQSSTLDVAVAALAIDGITDGVWSHGSVTHTVSLEDSWWQVDLRDQFVLEEIVLHNRTGETYYRRLSNFIVSVLRDGTTVWAQHYDGTPPDSIPLHFDLPGGTIGDTVRVQLDGWNNLGDGTLSLAEVQVFGYEASRLYVTALLSGGSFDEGSEDLEFLPRRLDADWVEPVSATPNQTRVREIECSRLLEDSDVTVHVGEFNGDGCGDLLVSVGGQSPAVYLFNPDAKDFSIFEETVWSVDLQGDGGTTMSGVEPYYGFGNVWNPCNIANFPSGTDKPEWDLVDSNGNPTSVRLAVEGVEGVDKRVSAYTYVDGDDLKDDYLFVNSSQGFAESAAWKISGLMPGGTYEIFAYGSVTRDATFKVDVDGDGNLDNDTAQLVAGAGRLFAGITADANGAIVGSISEGTQTEANWGGFQLRQCYGTSSPSTVVPGDVNGDGLDDVLIVDSDQSQLSLFLHYGWQAGEDTRFEFASHGVGEVSIVGDLNRDGYDEIAVSGAREGSGMQGGLFVFFGGPDLQANLTPDDADLVFSRDAAAALPEGQLLEGPLRATAGDFNGDGETDLVIGEPWRVLKIDGQEADRERNMLAKANKQWQEYLASWQQPEINEDLLAEVHEVVERAERQIGS